MGLQIRFVLRGICNGKVIIWYSDREEEGQKPTATNLLQRGTVADCVRNYRDNSGDGSRRQAAPWRLQHTTVYVQDIRDLASTHEHGDRANRHVNSYRMNSIRPKRKQRQREHTKQWRQEKHRQGAGLTGAAVLYHSHVKLMPIRSKDTKSSEPHY